MPRLQASKQNAGAVDTPNAGIGDYRRWCAAQKKRSCYTTSSTHLAETWLLVFQLRRFRPVAVDVALNYRIPARRQIVGQLVAAAAIVKRQASRQDEQIFVAAPFQSL